MDFIPDTLDGIALGRIGKVCEKHNINPADMVNKDELDSVGLNLNEQLKNFEKYLGEPRFNKLVAGGSLMPALDRWAAEVTDKNVTKITSNFHKKIAEHDPTLQYEDAKRYILYVMQMGASGAPQ
jgi:hypothetical protein